MNLVLLAMWCGLLFSPQQAQTSVKGWLTKTDKAQIVEAIFRQEFSECENPQVPKDEYVSLENIEATYLPKLSCINLIALTQAELGEKRKEGVSFYRFDKFEVQDRQVIVGLSRTHVSGQYIIQGGKQYQYRKKGKRWVGDLNGVYGGVTDSGAN